MSNHSILIYENNMMEDLEKAILNGKYSNEKLVQLIENKTFNKQQLKLIAELAPMLGGGFTNPGGAGQAATNQLSAPNPNAAPQQNNNANVTKQQWQQVEQALKQSNIEGLLQKMVQGSQDATLTKYVENLGAWIAYVRNYVAKVGAVKPTNPAPNNINGPTTV